MIGSIGSGGYSIYTLPVAGSNMIGGATPGVNRVNGVTPVSEKGTIEVGKTQKTECQTCKSRKYVDVSDESNVSFQSPTNVSPEASFAAVAAHEGQHVSNAVAKGAQEGNELISASVSYKMGICPECGKAYIAGGTTTTQIRYNESNPYESSRKSAEGSLLKGMNFDAVA